MEWDYKGIRFTFQVESLGPFFMATARTPKEGPYVRVRPFSALGRSEEAALEMLKEQIALEYRRVPDFPSTSSA